jgi:hypothetical protein
MLFAHFLYDFLFFIIVFKVLHVLGMYKHYYSVIYNVDILFLFLKFYLLDCDPSDFHVKFLFIFILWMLLNLVCL